VYRKKETPWDEELQFLLIKEILNGFVPFGEAEIDKWQVYLGYLEAFKI